MSASLASLSAHLFPQLLLLLLPPPPARLRALRGQLPRALALQSRRRARVTTAGRTSTSQGRRGNQTLTRGAPARAGVPGENTQPRRRMPAARTPAHRRLQRLHGSRPCEQATHSTRVPTRWKPSTAGRLSPLQDGRFSRPSSPPKKALRAGPPPQKSLACDSCARSPQTTVHARTQWRARALMRVLACAGAAAGEGGQV